MIGRRGEVLMLLCALDAALAYSLAAAPTGRALGVCRAAIVRMEDGPPESAVTLGSIGGTLSQGSLSAPSPPRPFRS